MNIQNILNYIKKNSKARLKTPFVSKDYTPEEVEELLRGFEMALSNGEKKLSGTHIIEVFNAAKPALRANMKFPLRKGTIAFHIGGEISRQGLLDVIGHP